MERYLFVVNPISGGKDKTEFIKELEALCIAERLEYRVLQTQGDDDLERIAEQLKDFRPSVAVACGGDGTVSLLGQCLLHTDIPLGIIPLGSANGLATELNIPTGIQEALQVVRKGRQQLFDVLCINGEHHCLHLSDLGFNATIVNNFENSNLRGQMAYLLFFIKSLFYNYTRLYRFELPDQAFRRTAAMVVFANGRKYGIGAAVNPIGRPGDGRFEICIFKRYPWYAFFGMLFLFLTGRLRSSRYYRVLSTDRVKVTTRRPVELQVDGESLGQVTEVEVKVLPCVLQVLVGSVEPDK